VDNHWQAFILLLAICLHTHGFSISLLISDLLRRSNFVLGVIKCKSLSPPQLLHHSLGDKAVFEREPAANDRHKNINPFCFLNGGPEKLRQKKKIDGALYVDVLHTFSGFQDGETINATARVNAQGYAGQLLKYETSTYSLDLPGHITSL